jgi:hypothetical protein
LCNAAPWRSQMQEEFGGRPGNAIFCKRRQLRDMARQRGPSGTPKSRHKSRGLIAVQHQMGHSDR